MWFLTPARSISPAGEWIDLVAMFEGQQAELVSGTPEDWRQIHVTYADDSWSFDFKRYSVGEDNGRWTDDLSFFRSWLGVVSPAVNVQWVTQYLTRVQTVFMFRCSNGAPDTSLELVREILQNLREDPSGLLYVGLEGWSNEYGHLTWEFTDRVTGAWEMALRRDSGWETFQMDLENRTHRHAFQAGEVPAGVESRFYRDRGSSIPPGG